MVSFACKEVKLEEIIKCSFDFNKTEYKVFTFLLRLDKSITVIGISNRIKLDRSTVQKAIRKLVNRDLILRKQRNLPKGSYVYLYKLKDKIKIKKNLKEIIRNWSNSAEQAINYLLCT